MPELSFKIRRAVDTYQPIDMDGLRFFPIPVRHMEMFSVAKGGITILQQALPLQYISMPLLSALYAMELDAITDGTERPGFFSLALLLLALSLRLVDEEEPDETLKIFGILTDSNDPKRLKQVVFPYEGELHAVSPVQFSRYRPIIAAQNGIELEAVDANPDLVQAERDLAELNAPKLDYRTESLVSAICALCRVDEAEIYDWPILKLQRRRESLERILNYAVCAINEGAGCKWKRGNPSPSPLFDRLRTMPGGVIPIGDFAGGAAAKAVNSPGQTVS